MPSLSATHGLLSPAALAVAALLALVASGHAQINLDIMVCNSTTKFQQWSINPSGLDHLVVASNNFCIDAEGYATNDGTNLWTYACHPSDKNPAHQNQAWTVHSDGTITENMSGKCISVDHAATSAGSNVVLWECGAQKGQTWEYDTTTKQFKDTNSGLCLDSGTPVPPPPPPCTVSPGKDQPWCDASLSLDARVANLVSLIPDTDKLGLFMNGAQGVPSLNIQPYQWWSEALHGVANSPGVHYGGAIPASTSFPQVILTASSFNSSLYHDIGHAISTEARAMNNKGRAGLTFWAPNINIFRDPRWGRGQETPGEDPYLNGIYVANFVQGMQNGTDEKYLKVSSCCKHYDAYSLEDWHGMDRYHFNAIVTPQDFNDTYLPAWKSCVRDGKASSIMCSYNAENGVPSCANKKLMNDLARDTWGFEGYITSDCGAVNCVINDHHYTSTPDETCAVTLEAGMDIDCGSYISTNLQHALDSKAVSMETVDTALSHLFAVQFRLGMFDPYESQPYRQLGPDDVNTPAHQALALDAARQGITLMKNPDGVLPLDEAATKSVAVIGPNGDATTVMQGNYYGNAPYLISPVDGIKSYTSATYTQGCTIAANDTSGFPAALAAAEAADVAVVVIGLDQTQEREGLDRVIVSLPGVQNQLVAEVAAKAKKTVVVVMSGGPVDLSEIDANPAVHAIMWVGYPGQSGGQAMADVLFGAVNPSGRLPVTWVKEDFIRVSMEDMGMRPNATALNPGRTYRFFTGTPVYPFGHGMSYTTFDLAWASAPAPAMQTQSTPETTMSVKVTNTGDRDGTETLLVFAAPPSAGKGGDPIKSLVAFGRVAVAAKASETISFSVAAEQLMLTDARGMQKYTPGQWTFTVGSLSGSVKLQ